MPDRNYNNNNNRNDYIEAKALPEDYVMVAEEVIKNHVDRTRNRKNNLTTTKLRRLLSLILDIYNEENLLSGNELTDKNKKKLQLALMRMYYEAGRERDVKDFLRDSDILAYLKDINGDRKKFLDFTHYMESLVAFHRYYKGEK